MSDKPQALVHVVEDDAAVARLITGTLERFGYRHAAFSTGSDFLRQLRVQVPDVAILDLGLPDMDGMEVLQQLRSRYRFGLLIATGRDDTHDRVMGLELGADDYMTKPFSPRELVARVKAVLRRSQKEASLPGELVIGRLRFNFSRYEVHMGNVKLELTPKEYELLKMLATNLGKVFTREQLLEKVWGYEYFGDTRTVDVHVRHLRAKMAADPITADALETIRGFGYRMREVE